MVRGGLSSPSEMKLGARWGGAGFKAAWAGEWGRAGAVDASGVNEQKLAQKLQSSWLWPAGSWS